MIFLIVILYILLCTLSLEFNKNFALGILVAKFIKAVYTELASILIHSQSYLHYL